METKKNTEASIEGVKKKEEINGTLGTWVLNLNQIKKLGIENSIKNAMLKKKQKKKKSASTAAEVKKGKC